MTGAPQGIRWRRHPSLLIRSVSYELITEQPNSHRGATPNTPTRINSEKIVFPKSVLLGIEPGPPHAAPAVLAAGPPSSPKCNVDNRQLKITHQSRIQALLMGI